MECSSGFSFVQVSIFQGFACTPYTALEKCDLHKRGHLQYPISRCLRILQLEAAYLLRFVFPRAEYSNQCLDPYRMNRRFPLADQCVILNVDSQDYCHRDSLLQKQPTDQYLSNYQGKHSLKVSQTNNSWK